MVFAGPTRPGTSVSTFRATGVSAPVSGSGGGGGDIKGPTRPGTDVEVFRKTGQSVISGSEEALRIRADIAAQEKQAEATRIEAQKISTQLEKERQETIRAGTVVGQLEKGGPKPFQVDLPPTNQRGFVTTGFGRAAFESGKQIVRRFTKTGGDRPSLSAILAPFDRTVKPKFAQQAFIDPVTDKVVSAEKLTGTQIKLLKESGVDIKTFGEFQTGIEQERSKLISAERERLQSGIDIGGDFETAQKEFTSFQKDVFKTTPDVKGIKEPRRSPVRTFVDVSLTSTPLTSFAAAAAVSKTDPVKVDVEAIKSGASIGAVTTQRPGVGTAGFLVGGLIGGASRVSAGGREVTLGTVEEALSQSRLSQRGVRLVTKEKIIDVSAGIGRAEGTTALQRSIVVSKVSDGGKIVSSVGREEFIATGKTFFAEKPFVLGGSREILAKTSVLEGFGKVTPGISDVFVRERTGFEAVLGKKGLVGESKIFPQAQFKLQQPSVSLGTKVDDIILSTGGRIKGVSIETVETKGVRGFGDVRIDFPKETEAALKIIRPKGDSGITSFKGVGGGTPLSKTFAVSKLETLPSLKPTTLKPTPTKPSTARVVAEVSFKGIPRAVDGGGLTTKQIQRGQPKQLSQGLDLGGFQQLTFPGGRIDQLSGPQAFGTAGSLDLSGLALFTRGASLEKTRLGAVSRSLSTERLVQPQAVILKQRVAQVSGLKTQLLQETITPTDTFRGRRPFELRGGFDILPPIAFPPSLGGVRTRGRPQRRVKRKVPIRPSFTGIILDIEEAAAPVSIGGLDIGVSPFAIRGLETGFDVPKRKKKKAKKKSKKK